MAVIEDLSVNGMVKGPNLAQAISDVGMGELRRQLAYKANWYGVELLVADRFFPSSRLCRFYGHINSKLKLSDREWTCDCGVVHERDENAAINHKSLAYRTASSAGSDACGDEKLQPLGSAPRGNRNQTSDLPLLDSSKF